MRLPIILAILNVLLGQSVIGYNYSSDSDYYTRQYSKRRNELAERNIIDNHPNWSLLERERCGSSLADRIIGGQNASLGQYPWIARLGYSNTKKPMRPLQFSCGGSLITPCWVLSASHCVTGLPKDMHLSGIRLGEYDISQDIDCDDHDCAQPTQDFAPKRVLIHRDYGSPPFKNDISLIKLKGVARITKWVQTICLPYGNLLNKDLEGNTAEVAGWGITNVMLSTSTDVLLTVKLPIVSNKQCKNAFKEKADIDHKQLCVGGRIGADSCGGDSGGPLMKVDVITMPKYYVFGIVSFGSKYCGERPTPAVYTKIAEYLVWILNNITPC